MIRLFFIFCTLVFVQGADHLLLTRLVTQPNKAESFSIYNPTDSPINLSNYYICDDEEYYKIHTEGDLSPSSSISGFTAKFPDTSLPPGDTFHIVLNENYNEFYGEDFVPDLIMYGSDDNSMLETESRSIGFSKNKLEESSELIILFKWDGINGNHIEDIDYFLWGAYQTPINKIGISHYHNDTPIESQLFFENEAETYYAYSRIETDEIDETQTGGNGITGHGETSENFRKSWTIIRIPEFIYGCTDIYAVNYNPLAEYEINTYYEHKTGIFEFNPSLSCRYSFEQILDNEFHIGYSNIKVYGRVVDFFDIRTVANSGPQNITIEDENGYRITITIWDWEVSESKISAILTEYNKNQYYLWVEGELDYYDKYNEWQVTVASSDHIMIANNFTPDGEYESSSTSLQTSINPEPYIIIPTLNETLDYNFTFPDKSRVIVRIFDISGRFITSLIDQYFISSGTVYCNNQNSSWDGRDNLDQIVPPGTYIMHIQSMNPATGETHTDTAPIVIGVKN